MLQAELCRQCCCHGPSRPLLAAAFPVVVVIGLMSQVLDLVLESSCGRLEDCLASPDAPAASAGLNSSRTGLEGGVGGGHAPCSKMRVISSCSFSTSSCRLLGFTQLAKPTQAAFWIDLKQCDKLPVP